MIHYSEGAQLLEGLPTQIAQYNIGEGKYEEKTEKTSFIMRVSNNIHNIACLDEAEFIQEWTEMEKIPVKASPITVTKKDEAKPAAEGEATPAEEVKTETIESEQKFETKEKKKKNFSHINFKTSNFALAPKVRTAFFEIENTLTAEDEDLLEMKALRNGLEAYAYEMRNNLDSYGSFEKYLDEPTRTSFLAELNQVVEWIYGEGESAPKNEYRARLEKFRTIGEPVRNRFNYYSELDIYFEQFDKLAAAINEKLASIEHLTD